MLILVLKRRRSVTYWRFSRLKEHLKYWNYFTTGTQGEAGVMYVPETGLVLDYNGLLSGLASYYRGPVQVPGLNQLEPNFNCLVLLTLKKETTGQNLLWFKNWNMFGSKLWPSATKWGSLRGVSKVRKVFHSNKALFSTHFDAKMITLRCSYQKLIQNVEHLHAQYSKQFYREMGCQRL